MKYNKSEIMKQAHKNYREHGVDQSTALRMAWIEAKIEVLKSESFFLNMKDRWDSRDEREDRQRSAKINLLIYDLWACTHPQKATA